MSTIQANAILDASGGNTVTVNGVTPNSDVVKGRNLIINGAMQVAQRGTGAVTSNSSYPIDRWRTYSNGSVYSMQQYNMSQSDLNSTGHTKALKVTVTTAESTIGANNYVSVLQKFEGQDLQHLLYGGSSAKNVTLSFWAKSNKTGIYTVWLQNSSNGTNQRILKEYTINSANTWEQKEIVIVGNTVNDIVNTSGVGIQLGFNFAWGSTYDGGTTDTWFNTSAGHFSTSNQVNFMDNTSNEFYITGVKLEVGSVATEFDHRSYGEELALCQRYYQRDQMYLQGYQVAPNDYSITYQFPVVMRTAPTAAFTAAADISTNVNVGQISSPVPNTSSTNNGKQIRFYVDPASTGYVEYNREFEADAEL